MQAGTLHRTRLRAAKRPPPSASTSLTKGGGPSTPAAGWAGKAKRPARARGQEGGPAPGKGSRHGAAHTTGYVRSLARRAWRRAAPSALFW